MGTLRVSAITLEAFRLYTTSDWMTEKALLATIRGVVAPTPEMILGRAYHAVLEDPRRYQVPHGYRCERYSFSDDTMQPLLTILDAKGCFEVKSTTRVEDVTLVAQADYLYGSALHEVKTTAGSFVAEKYADSYQWRVMGLIFQPTVITYHVASLDDHHNSVVELRSLDSLSFYPYPQLEADVRALLREFIAYVRLKGLVPLLEERQRLAV